MNCIVNNVNICDLSTLKFSDNDVGDSTDDNGYNKNNYYHNNNNNYHNNNNYYHNNNNNNKSLDDTNKNYYNKDIINDNNNCNIRNYKNNISANSNKNDDKRNKIEAVSGTMDPSCRTILISFSDGSIQQWPLLGIVLNDTFDNDIINSGVVNNINNDINSNIIKNNNVMNNIINNNVIKNDIINSNIIKNDIYYSHHNDGNIHNYLYLNEYFYCCLNSNYVPLSILVYLLYDLYAVQFPIDCCYIQLW